MNWTIILDNLSSFIALAATVIASITAVWGINAWKREHLGKSKIDLAERVLELAYQIQELIEDIQSPLGFGNEGMSRKSSSEETAIESAVLNASFVTVERFEKCRPIFSEFYSLRFRCRIRLGEECFKLIEELWQIRHEFSRPFRRLQRKIAYLKQRPGSDMDSEEHEIAIQNIWNEEQEQYDNRKVSERTAKIVSRLEHVCLSAFNNPSHLSLPTNKNT